MRVLVLEGGRSLEHDVSLRSAGTIVEALTRLGHEVSLMEIGMDGRIPPSLLEPDADIIYPVMHGHQGEDGIIQAVAESQEGKTLGRSPRKKHGTRASVAAIEKEIQDDQ